MPHPDKFWLQRMFDLFGGLPRDYLVIDTETNHINHRSEKTWLVQAGYTVVRDCQIVQRQAFCLDWYDILDATDLPTYYTGIDKVAVAMAAKGRPTSISSAAVRQHGVPARTILNNLHALLVDCLTGNHWIAGFNLIGFDIPFLERIFATYHQPLLIPWDRCIDVGMIEKGLVANLAPPDATLHRLDAWYDIARRAFCREKWNLSEHCVPKYLHDPQAPLDVGGFHTADYDCEITHRVLEQMRQYAEQD